MKNYKKESAITLITLIITILVVIIVAGVAIATITGADGILSKVAKADEDQTHSEVKEQIIFELNAYQIDKYVSENITFIEYLANKGYIDDDGIVNVEKLLGKKASLGNGTGDTDIYKFEAKKGAYYLNYIKNEKETIEIWNLQLIDPAIFKYDINEDGTLTITGIKDMYKNEYMYKIIGYGVVEEAGTNENDSKRISCIRYFGWMDFRFCNSIKH